ncbi:MAG TPA: hypothetical protein VKF60_05435 [Myxococcota bacterium]|nr:hypothetical protein [Myxococcota bacterium]
MTRSILRPAFALLIPLAMFAFASAAPAKDKKPTDVKAVCLKEVKQHLKVKHEHAHDIELTPSREWQQTSTQSGISGTGVFKVADNKLRNFEWSCVYDVTKNKVVDISLEKPKKVKK